MDVFISWSGTRSRDVALALRDWLPLVINSLTPFVSAKDIYAGSRWQSEVAARLEASQFGIICVTRDNQDAPWLNFEAGAVAKAVDSSRVVPLAIDLKPSDISLPLGQFQAQDSTEVGLGAILMALNAVSPNPLGDALLTKALHKWWPDLETEFERIAQREAAQVVTASTQRTERELLEETLDTVRSLARLIPARQTSTGIGGELALSKRILPILARSEVEIKLIHGPGRVIIETERRLPDELCDEVERIANSYAIAIEYLYPPNEVPVSRSEQSPWSSRSHWTISRMLDPEA